MAATDSGTVAEYGPDLPTCQP